MDENEEVVEKVDDEEQQQSSLKNHIVLFFNAIWFSFCHYCAFFATGLNSVLKFVFYTVPVTVGRHFIGHLTSFCRFLWFCFTTPFLFLFDCLGRVADGTKSVASSSMESLAETSSTSITWFWMTVRHVADQSKEITENTVEKVKEKRKVILWPLLLLLLLLLFVLFFPFATVRDKVERSYNAIDTSKIWNLIPQFPELPELPELPSPSSFLPESAPLPAPTEPPPIRQQVEPPPVAAQPVLGCKDCWQPFSDQVKNVSFFPLFYLDEVLEICFAASCRT